MHLSVILVRARAFVIVLNLSVGVSAGAVGVVQSDSSPISSSAASFPRPRIDSVALNAPTVGESATLFERLPGQQTGIDLVYEFPKSAPFELLQDQGSGAGVCVGDYDGDGDADIFLTNYDRGNRLYRNLGQWRFEDVTSRAGVRDEGRWCSGAAFVDIDNDGDLDLSVSVFNAPESALCEPGRRHVQRPGPAFGLDFRGASVTMAFADYDQDGRLDAICSHTA